MQAVNKTTGSGVFSKADKEHLLLAATFTGEMLKTATMQEENEATQREVILKIAETLEVRSTEAAGTPDVSLPAAGC